MYIDKAIKLDNKCGWNFHVRGGAKLQLADYKGAIADYSRAIKLKCTDEYTYSSLAWCQVELKQWEKARKNFEIVLTLAPADDKVFLAEVYNCISFCGSNLGQQEEALEYINKYIELDPDNIQSYTARGSMNNEIGNYKQAIEDYKKSLDLGCDNSRVYALIAEVYIKMNDIDHLVEYCNLYLEKAESDDQKTNTINILTKHIKKLLKKYPKNEGLTSLKERIMKLL